MLEPHAPPQRKSVQNLLPGFLRKSTVSPKISASNEGLDPSELQVGDNSAPFPSLVKDDLKWLAQEVSRRRLTSWVMFLMTLRYVTLLAILLIPGSPLVDKIIEILVSDRVLDWAFKEMIRHSFPN